VLSLAPGKFFVRKRHIGVLMKMATIAMGCIFMTQASAERLNWSLSTQAGTKPEYYIDASQYVSFGVTGSYSVSDWSLSLTQSATSLVRDESVNEDPRWFGDTFASVQAPLLYSDKRNSLSLGLSSNVLQNTDHSWDQTKLFDAGIRLSWSHKWKKLTIGPNLSAKRYVYKEKFGKTGSPNYPYQYAMGISTSYKPLTQWVIGASYSLIQQQYFTGEDGYFYSLGAYQSYTHDSQLTLTVGLSTSDSQLAGTSNNPVYLYKENLTEAYVSASYSI